MTIVFISFIVFLLIGMPVAFAIGIAGVFFFLQYPMLPFTMTIQLLVSQTQNSALLAIPLFVLAANLLNACGISEKLLKLATQLTGHMIGGLAQVGIVLSTLMGGVSGSATADAAMQARILGKDMIARGYARGYVASNLAWSSLITATLPPGIGIILYGTVGEVSIGRLFAAGLFVGLFLMVVFMIAVRITSKRLDYKPERVEMASFKEIMHSLKETIWALLFPLMLLIGIRFGMFSISEIGAFAVFYALFVGLFVYRVLNFTNFLESLRNAVVDIGAIMFIIAMSGIFGYGIPFERVPQRITDSFLGVTTEPILLLFMIVGFLFLIGLFVEGSVLIILLTPIFLPLVRSVGIDPVVFGLIFCTTITASLNTPPVGISMFAVNSILGASLGEYLRHSLPWLLVVLVTLTFMIFFPGAVLFLPNFFFG